MIPKQDGPDRAGGATEAHRYIAERRSRFDTTRGRPRQWRRLRPDRSRSSDPIDFAAVDRAALGRLPEILARWLPGGRVEGREYVVRNPKRRDQRPGSFKVNLDTGRWADWATGDKGGDPISLAAYLAGCSQVDAACRLAVMLGITADGR
jgi:hypothetical protein